MLIYLPGILSRIASRNQRVQRASHEAALGAGPIAVQAEPTDDTTLDLMRLADDGCPNMRDS